MRRSPILLLVALLLLTAVPVHAEGTGQSASGSIVFTDASHIVMDVDISVDYAIIDGRNVSADEIREALLSGDSATEDALNGMADSFFNEMLDAIHAEGNLSTPILLGDSGPVIDEMNGGASMANSSCKQQIYMLLGESGAVFVFDLPQSMPSSIEILPPAGYTINDRSSFIWDGSRQQISVSSDVKMKKNLTEVLIDIYRIDTTGSNQRIYLNISLSSRIYSITYPGDKPLNRSIYLDKASIHLINAMIDCGYVDRSLWSSSIESTVQDAKELMMAEFQNITFSHSGWEDTGSEVRMEINASASMPVSALLGASALLRHVIYQDMNFNLYSTPGFITNYTILIPAGMLMGNVRISPCAENYHINEGGRQGVHVEIDDGKTRSITIEIGILVDLDPLTPLITAVIIVTIVWLIIMYLVPARRRR